jgi:chromosome segregation ATPase
MTASAFETIADDLYAGRPDDFAATRDEAIKKARADKNAELARELGKLRKPTQSAWLINLLWRDQHDVLEQMLQLGQELGHAQAAASGPALQRLTAQRRELESALIRRARELAEAEGVSVSAQMEREAQETLAAAIARPDVAEEVRSGRLVKPASYAGFGEFPTTLPPRPTKAEPEPEHVDEVAARRARDRLEAAERRVAEARTEVRSARRALDQETEAAQEAEQRNTDLTARVAQLNEQLSRLEKEAAAAEREAHTAGRAREHAERAHAAAERALTLAEKELAELDGD